MTGWPILLVLVCLCWIAFVAYAFNSEQYTDGAIDEIALLSSAITAAFLAGYLVMSMEVPSWTMPEYQADPVLVAGGK